MPDSNGRYVVLCYAPEGPHSYEPEPPTTANTVTSLREARDMFAAWLTASGNDFTRSETYGQPWADVVLRDAWDGVSYGDITGGTGVLRFERARRGGIRRERY